MIDFNSLFLIGSISLMFALLTAGIIAADTVVNLQKEANRRLNPRGFHWQFFRLTKLPADESGRMKKLHELGKEKGLLQGAAMESHVGFLIGAWLLVRWTIYPKAKKRALRAIAKNNDHDPEVVCALARILE